ncbi:MAG: hypothetical protein EBZ67_07140 [Chitinophagia bacterium]|nr:hypothetical protein [Chitinophagia bacterium]
MKQYVIISHDGRDEGAPERRMATRPRHLDGARKLKSEGRYVMGGAILDDEGKMKGSVMILQFETEEDFREWYANEPYITEGVWKSIEVKPFRVAEV